MIVYCERLQSHEDETSFPYLVHSNLPFKNTLLKVWICVGQLIWHAEKLGQRDMWSQIEHTEEVF